MVGAYLTALLCIPRAAFGMSLAPISLEELFREADIVAIVQVSEGHLLGEGESSCGARYKGRVEHLFKGAQEYYIDFGHYHGYGPGGRYLLFLTRRKDEFMEFFAMMSKNAEATAFVADFNKRCEPVLSPNRVMHGGTGAMKFKSLQPTADFVLIPTRLIPVPESLKRIKAEALDASSYEDAVWVKEEDLVQYLRGLQ